MAVTIAMESVLKSLHLTKQLFRYNTLNSSSFYKLRGNSTKTGSDTGSDTMIKQEEVVRQEKSSKVTS